MRLDTITTVLVIAAITAVVLVSTLAISTNFIPLMSPLTVSAQRPECTGDGKTTIGRIVGEVPAGYISSTTLIDAARDGAIIVGEGGREFIRELEEGSLPNTYNLQPGALNYVVNNPKDGIIDCATLELTIEIRYLEWTNVGTLSQCVQDAWNTYRAAVARHELRHAEDDEQIWDNAHLQFVGQPISSIESIINRLGQQSDDAGDAWNNIDKPQFPQCCAGASYGPLPGGGSGCVCDVTGAVYNEQGGTADNPNGGCECPEGKEPFLNRFVFPPAEECRDKCQFGRNSITGICRPAPVACPPCDSSRNFQCINGSCQCAPGWRLINGWCRPPQTCRECSNSNPCPSTVNSIEVNLACVNFKCYPTYAEESSPSPDCDPSRNCCPGENCCNRRIASCYDYRFGLDRCILPGRGTFNPTGETCANDCP
jgi:hypothetical protein